MGPATTYSDCRSVQDGIQDGGRLPRPRQCLLKGCACWFRAAHPLARYCSPGCLAAARRWQRWLSNRRYRQSEQGQQRRRAQSQRRRERERERTAVGAGVAGEQREGYPKAAEGEKNPCRRPGCYECFAATARSPLQKFCSPSCRKALHRVLERESRWRQRLSRLSVSVGRWLRLRC